MPDITGGNTVVTVPGANNWSRLTLALAVLTFKATLPLTFSTEKACDEVDCKVVIPEVATVGVATVKLEPVSKKPKVPVTLPSVEMVVVVPPVRLIVMLLVPTEIIGQVALTAKELAKVKPDRVIA